MQKNILSIGLGIIIILIVQQNYFLYPSKFQQNRFFPHKKQLCWCQLCWCCYYFM